MALHRYRSCRFPLDAAAELTQSLLPSDDGERLQLGRAYAQELCVGADNVCGTYTAVCAHCRTYEVSGSAPTLPAIPRAVRVLYVDDRVRLERGTSDDHTVLIFEKV